MNDRISRFQQFIDDIRSLETLNLHQYASADEMWTVWKENFKCKLLPLLAINMLQKSRKVWNKLNPRINDQLLHEKRHKNYLEDWENCKHARNDYNRLTVLYKNTKKSYYSNDIENNKGNLKKPKKALINA